MLLRCHRALVDGEIHCGSQSNVDDDNHTTSILQCAASLYYRIWYFRTIQQKDLRRACGFAMTSYTKSTTVGVSVSLLLLEKPTWSNGSCKPKSSTANHSCDGEAEDSIVVGGRYPLYVYTKIYELPAASTGNTGTSSEILFELARFLFGTCALLPCPYRDTESLSGAWRSPGCMLLPGCGGNAHARGSNSIPKEDDTDQCAKRSEPGLSIVRGCEVIPTITGSLVVRCRDAKAVLDLLQARANPIGINGEEEGLDNWVASFAATEAIETNDTTVWYVKYKTPSFGQFWDLSRLAINGTRSSLLKGKQSHPPCIRRWLRLHKIDSYISSSRSITITRSAGVPLSVALPKVSWGDFCIDFLGLALSTLEVQRKCHSLVHGDINEGNVLFDDSSTTVGHRCSLIDWDEAMRPKPCPRFTRTDEEKMRYPSSLLDFPEEYTQQQLMHLFGTLVWKYYPCQALRVVEATNGDVEFGHEDDGDRWMQPILRVLTPSNDIHTSSIDTGYISPSSTRTELLSAVAGITITNNSGKNFLGRSAVEGRFRAMLRGLERHEKN